MNLIQIIKIKKNEYISSTNSKNTEKLKFKNRNKNSLFVNHPFQNYSLTKAKTLNNMSNKSNKSNKYNNKNHINNNTNINNNNTLSPNYSNNIEENNNNNYINKTKQKNVLLNNNVKKLSNITKYKLFHPHKFKKENKDKN